MSSRMFWSLLLTVIVNESNLRVGRVYMASTSRSQFITEELKRNGSTKYGGMLSIGSLSHPYVASFAMETKTKHCLSMI